MTKPAPDFNFPKIVTVIEDYWVPRKGPFPDFYPKICIKRAKSRFLAVTPIFVRLSLIMLQKLTFFIFNTLFSDVGNMPCPKICRYPKSALTGAFWPKIRFFVLETQFLSTGRLLPYVWRPFYPLDPSQYLFVFEIRWFERGSPPGVRTKGKIQPFAHREASYFKYHILFNFLCRN